MLAFIHVAPFMICSRQILELLTLPSSVTRSYVWLESFAGDRWDRTSWNCILRSHIWVETDTKREKDPFFPEPFLVFGGRKQRKPSCLQIKAAPGQCLYWCVFPASLVSTEIDSYIAKLKRSTSLSWLATDISKAQRWYCAMWRFL